MKKLLNILANMFSKQNQESEEYNKEQEVKVYQESEEYKSLAKFISTIPLSSWVLEEKEACPDYGYRRNLLAHHKMDEHGTEYKAIKIDIRLEEEDGLTFHYIDMSIRQGNDEIYDTYFYYFEYGKDDKTLFYTIENIFKKLKDEEMKEAMAAAQERELREKEKAAVLASILS